MARGERADTQSGSQSGDAIFKYSIHTKKDDFSHRLGINMSVAI